MSGPGKHDICIQQSADFVLEVKLQTQTGTATPVPVVITGATIKMEVRVNYADFDPVVLLTASTGDGRIVITDGVNGKFLITIPAAATALAGQIPKTDAGKYDIDVTLSGGAKSTPLGGNVTFYREVTT